MSAFVLTVRPDGNMLLTTEERLSQGMADRFTEQFERWSATPNGVAVIGDCRVQHAVSIEISLPVDADSPASLGGG